MGNEDDNAEATTDPAGRINELVMPGDNFTFNIPLMVRNNIVLPKFEEREKLHTAIVVEHEKDLGRIVTYKTDPLAQVNAAWIVKA